jgi:hypothetical protein
MADRANACSVSKKATDRAISRQRGILQQILGDRMMKRLVTFSLMTAATLGFAPAAMACSCVGTAPFVKTASVSALVVRGKVLEYQWHPADTQHQRPMSMVVEVQDVLKGASPSKRISIWGDNGMICRRYVSEFPIGTEWVMAVSPDQWSQKGELAISSCGEYALPVQGNQVQGKIAGKVPERVTLPKLRALLKTPPKVRRSAGDGPCADRG